MAVELSFEFTGPTTPDRSGRHDSLELWALAVGAATEACLVVDANGDVVAASPGCGELFAIDDVASVRGLRLVDEVLELRDFSASAGKLPPQEVEKIPPLLAMTSKGLARGLLRVKGAHGTSTVDAISVPLGDKDAAIGSLTFFAQVNR